MKIGINLVGNDNLKWVCDDYLTASNNDLYKLMRHG